MTTATGFKNRAVSFLENAFTHKGNVLAIRAWTPATFYEVDVHLPDEKAMNSWHKAQHIKVKVGPFTFRDYTPAGWDAATRTCTLYIDAAHDGPGAAWVKNLQPGEVITYLGVAPTFHALLPGAQAVFLGDQSALGHFLALMQVAGKQAAIKGAIVLPEKAHRSQYEEYIVQLPLHPLSVRRTLADSMVPWIKDQLFPEESIFYLVGNAALVTSTRTLLKQKGINPKQIKAQGFWH